MIRSFERARLDQVFFLHEHSYPRRLLAELIWVICQENIREFLLRIPAERKCLVQFERLVEDPRRHLSRLCEMIGIPFDPAMLDPYGDRRKRMSDGIYPESKMLGDVKFHEHRGVEASAADAWKAEIDPASLGETTLRLATSLGYEMPPRPAAGQQPASSPAAGLAARPWENSPPGPAVFGHGTDGPGELRCEAERQCDQPLPLSFAQQRFWFLHQLNPGSPVYNVPWATRIEGPLDRSVPGAVLRGTHRPPRVTADHVSSGGRQSRPGSSVPVAGDDRDRGSDGLAAGCPRKGSPPAGGRGSLLPVRFVGRSPDTRQTFATGRRGSRASLDYAPHCLRRVVHGGRGGGACGALWGLLDRGRLPACQAAHPVPGFCRLAAAMAGHGDLADVARLLAKATGRALPLLELPTDRPRPAKQSHPSAMLTRTLPPSLLQAVQQVGRREGATVFMTLLAAFKTLLHRYTGQEDLVVGTMVSGRNLQEFEGQVGVFINTLALRTDFSGNPTFVEVLRLAETALAAFWRTEDVPFEKVVEEVCPQRNLSYSPLLQVLFVLQDDLFRKLPLPGLKTDRWDVHKGTAKFDLTVFACEEPAGLRLTVEYNTGLFEGSTIERMLGHFQTLLKEIVADPGGGSGGCRS